jgi:hypothetical protein
MAFAFTVPVSTPEVDASLEFPSQQPAAGGGCTGTFNIYSIGPGPTATLVSSGTFKAATLGTVVVASMVGTSVPPLNATLTLDVATQTGTIVEMFDSPGGQVTITTTFAKVMHAYVITGVTVTP